MDDDPQAGLGAKVDVPSLQGRIELKIPPGTQHGQMFRLAGKGLPDLRSGRNGDEIVEAVDVVYDHVPAGGTLTNIFREDDGCYGFGIGWAEDSRPPYNSTMYAQRGPRGWEVWEETWIGEWPP